MSMRGLALCPNHQGPELHCLPRAVEGLRRRRFQNRGAKEKILDTARSIFMVMATCSMAFGNWAQEVMGDPLWDAWAVLQPRHCEPVEDTPDVLELFAGHANISAAFAAKKRGVLEPRDLRYNHDLKDMAQQELVVEEMWSHRPKMVWLASTVHSLVPVLPPQLHGAGATEETEEGARFDQVHSTSF